MYPNIPPDSFPWISFSIATAIELFESLNESQILLPEYS